MGEMRLGVILNIITLGPVQSMTVRGLLCMIVISNALGPAREIGEKWSEQGLMLTINRFTGQ